jgi:hypothetical protein
VITAVSVADWAKLKKPAKKRYKKFVKLSDHTCACNDLTNFECEAQAIAETCMEKLVKSLWMNFFSAVFRHSEPLCALAPANVRGGAEARSECWQQGKSH